MIIWRNKVKALIKGVFSQRHTLSTDIIEPEFQTFGVESKISTNGIGLRSVLNVSLGVKSTIITSGLGIQSEISPNGVSIRSKIITTGIGV